MMFLLKKNSIIFNRLQNGSMVLAHTKHTPKGFNTINPKDDKYATLSWGMFDEIHKVKAFE